MLVLTECHSIICRQGVRLYGYYYNNYCYLELKILECKNVEIIFAIQRRETIEALSMSVGINRMSQYYL